MTNRRSFITTLLCLLALALGASGQTIKSRMADRLPAMDGLRAAGKVGENNQGFLTARTQLNAADEALLKAENADRKQVYATIATKTGESPEVVGQKRAESLRKLSKAGIWLQDAKGKWYRKQ